MAPTKEMLKIAIKHRPDFACLVPEKRKEITTEGGLNIKKNKKFLKKIIYQLKKNNIRCLSVHRTKNLRYLFVKVAWSELRRTSYREIL